MTVLWAILAALIITIIILAVQLTKYKEKSQQNTINQQQLQQQIERELKLKLQKRQNELENELNNSYLKKMEAQNQLLQDVMESKLAEIEAKYQKMDLEMAQSRAAENELIASQHSELLKSKESEFNKKLQELQDSYNSQVAEIKTSLQSWKNRADAAMTTFQQIFHYENKDSINRINLSPIEQMEVSELRAIIRKLSNPMPFYKAVYEIYYKSKAVALTNQLVGLKKTAGIYKITHVDSGRCYIGQSVDLKARWLQHIKRGCGAEPPTNSKLYPAMLELGIENFAFEIVEKIEDLSKLSESEKYWQNFYKAIEFGFSIR